MTEAFRYTFGVAACLLLAGAAYVWLRLTVRRKP
jgi:hypothetical protein